MTKENRKVLLASLEPGEERKLISYKDKKDVFPIYEIPLEALIYNPYNGRIKAIVKSWEARNEKLDPENYKDARIIEQFLWESAENRNKETKASINKYGQFETGIVTSDGVIIDGNRRASILNILNREDDGDRKFKAIILKDDLRDNPKEIIELETIYQMGVDSKVDYNPIEKYLRCEELRVFGFTDVQIADMLSTNLNEISKWFDIFSLMENYLNRYGYKNLYVALEKREGHFVDLRQYLRSYRQGVGRDYANWNYSESDLSDLKTSYNDYTRLRFPVQNCRIIANPRKSQSFFCNEKIWTEFYTNHNEIRNSIQEDDLDIIVESLKSKKIDEIIYYRDDLWRNKVKDDFQDNLFTHKRKLEDILRYSRPLKSLKSAKGTLESINFKDVADSPDPEITTISDSMIDILNQIKSKNNLV
tara:strand:+ start:2486 stop:3742 length:1257 start_codon:yes stop_codon:yes gene_type:complete